MKYSSSGKDLTLRSEIPPPQCKGIYGTATPGYHCRLSAPVLSEILFMNHVYGGMPTYITIVSNYVKGLCNIYSVNQNNFLTTGIELVCKICQVHPRCCYNHYSVKKLRGTISFYSFSILFILP
jgi:hypothetical protein